MRAYTQFAMGVNAKRSMQISRACLPISNLALTPSLSFQVPSKRRKIAPQPTASTTPAKSARVSRKQRASQRTTIEVPRGNRGSDDSELGDDDLGVFEEFGAGASFLQTLDEKGISRWVYPRLY